MGIAFAITLFIAIVLAFVSIALFLRMDFYRSMSEIEGDYAKSINNLFDDLVSESGKQADELTIARDRLAIEIELHNDTLYHMIVNPHYYDMDQVVDPETPPLDPESPEEHASTSPS